MKFYIAKITKQNGGSIDIKASEPLEGLQQTDNFASGYIFSGDVSVEGILTNVSGHINMNVVAQTQWKSECSRCLDLVEGNIEILINENFSQIRTSDEEPQDSEDYTFEGEWLEIDRAIADAILVSLPIAQLCKEDCKGLCPDCGTDMNETKCSCSENKINPAMEKLKNFNKE